MSPRNPGRLAAMTPGDVRARADAARKFLDVAQMVADDEDTRYRTVCASLAILSGIAAGDAICGHVLKKCFRGPDHHQASDLLRTVRSGAAAAKALTNLIGIKDAAQYGTDGLSADKTKQALRAAQTLVDEMERILLT